MTFLLLTALPLLAMASVQPAIPANFEYTYSQYILSPDGQSLIDKKYTGTHRFNTDLGLSYLNVSLTYREAINYRTGAYFTLDNRECYAGESSSLIMDLKSELRNDFGGEY